MDRSETINKGLHDLYLLLLNSKDELVKDMISNTSIRGKVSFSFINKREEKSKYNIIRMYVEKNNKKENLIDINWGFAEYSKHASKQRVTVSNNQVISWINLDNMYIKLILEKSPKEETNQNTILIHKTTEDVIEMLDNEAEYFEMKCREIRKNCNYLENSSPSYNFEETDVYYCYV